MPAEATSAATPASSDSVKLDPEHFWRAGELVCLVAILIGFFAANWHAVDQQRLWMDEVLHTDPPANLALGRGFTSTAWFYQDRHEFWAGNAPLHHFLMAGWFELFGFSPRVARSFDYTVAAVGGFLIWLALRQSRLITSPVLRLAVVPLVLLNRQVVEIYRTGRYDSAAFLVVCSLLVALVARPGRARHVAVFALAGLAPWAGLQMVVYLPLLSAIALAMPGRRAIRDAALVVAGVFTGLGALLGMYASLGVLEAFLKSVKGHPWVGTYNTVLGEGLSAKLGRLDFAALYAEPGQRSLALLAAFALVVSLAQRRPSRAAMFALASFALVPLVIAALGKVQVYYAWMTVLPLAIGALAGLDQLAPRWLFHVGQLVVVVLALGSAGAFWSDFIQRDLARAELTDVARMDRALAGVVRPDDWVFCEAPAYYACKRRAAMVFYWLCLEQLSAADARRVNLLVIRPNSQTGRMTLAAVGGDWQATGQKIPILNERLEPAELWVLRRAPATRNQEQ